jgi:hypothetical protein
MATAKTAKTTKTTQPNFLNSKELPLAITLRPFIIESLPRLRRIGRLSDAAISDPRSPLAPLGSGYRDAAHYRFLSRALGHLVAEDGVWQRVGSSQRTWIIMDFLQVAGAMFEITDARAAHFVRKRSASKRA